MCLIWRNGGGEDQYDDQAGAGTYDIDPTLTNEAEVDDNLIVDDDDQIADKDDGSEPDDAEDLDDRIDE